MLVSAIVCTFNRAALLPLALESLARQTLPTNNYEIIVVDDGSTDDTPFVSSRFAARHPNVVVVTQPNRGLSSARNAGWRKARSDVIAFLDDDAQAPTDWLQLIIAAFANIPESVACLGGPVRPLWEKPRPAWLTDNLLVWLTVHDKGIDRVLSSEAGLFAGANMAIRRYWLESSGGFDERFGRKGTNLLSREESNWWDSVRNQDALCLYDPDIWVEHFTPANRLKRGWFHRRLYWEGISQRIGELAEHPEPSLVRLLRAVNYFRVCFLSRAVLSPLFSFRSWTDVTWQVHVCFLWGKTMGFIRRP